MKNQKRINAKENNKNTVMEIQGEKEERSVEGYGYQKKAGKHRNIERTCRFWPNGILRGCAQETVAYGLL